MSVWTDLLPILMLFFSNVYKFINDDWKERNCALELHLSGFSMISAYLLMTRNENEIIKIIWVMNALMLLVTSALFTKLRDAPKKRWHEILIIAIGISVFTVDWIISSFFT